VGMAGKAGVFGLDYNFEGVCAEDVVNVIT
jgi:hypothetical protein